MRPLLPQPLVHNNVDVVCDRGSCGERGKRGGISFATRVELVAGPVGVFAV